jgi:hypothetical protein
LESGIYGIKSITMDTGAGYTILPEGFAKHLDILKPTGDKTEYYIFSGVGGEGKVNFPNETQERLK